MKIAIYSRGHDQELRQELGELVKELTTNNIGVLLHFSLSRFIQPDDTHKFEFFFQP